MAQSIDELIAEAINDEAMELFDYNVQDFTKKSEAAARKQRQQNLRDELKGLDQKDAYARRLQKELNKEELADKIQMLEDQSKTAKTLREREDAESELRQIKKDKQHEENVKKVAANLNNAINSGLEKLYSGMSNAAKTYSGFLDSMQTRLFGANENYNTITAKMSVAFGASPFFQMQDVMKKVTEAVNKGISFNIEARAAMEVLKDKVATTFDAFDSNLLRLIRIQQADSTQARLGMESFLNEFLNKQYQDTSYLNSLSTTVTANLLEAQSLMGRTGATEFEYAVQKWLGSFSSVGVSDNLIQQLSTGLGYLGSGNISALSSNQSLEQLLVASANRGGANYGTMLTQGVTTDDVTAIMKGLRYLVDDIQGSGNTVAKNQYAQLFGMSVSDIQSMLNITKEGMQQISGDLGTYSSFVNRVSEESTLSKLLSRTGGASIGDNLYQNFLSGAGQQIGKSAASYIGWEMAGVVSGLLKGVGSGVDVKPFGVGVHLDFDVGDVMKAATVALGSVGGIASMMAGLGSMGGVNLKSLMGGEESSRITSRGGALSFLPEGTRQSETTQYSDYSDSALVKSANATTSSATSKYLDEDFDEEKQKMEKTQKSMQEIGDNVAFIAHMLNESGIVIRGSVAFSSPIDPDTIFGGDGGKNLSAILGGA